MISWMEIRVVLIGIVLISMSSAQDSSPQSHDGRNSEFQLNAQKEIVFGHGHMTGYHNGNFYAGKHGGYHADNYSNDIFSSDTTTVVIYIGISIFFFFAVWYILIIVGWIKHDGHWKNKSTKKDEKTKTRRRREIETNEDITRLATMVLSAIESGECLQKTICLFGSQIGATRGALAFSYLDKLVPGTVQGNAYYVVLKRSLRGEQSCDKFRCPHPTFTMQ